MAPGGAVSPRVNVPAIRPPVSCLSILLWFKKTCWDHERHESHEIRTCRNPPVALSRRKRLTATPSANGADDVFRQANGFAHSMFGLRPTIVLNGQAGSMASRKCRSFRIGRMRRLASCCGRSAGSQTSTRAVRFPCFRSEHRRWPAPLG